MAQSKMQKLATELDKHRSIVNVDAGNHVVEISVDHGQYDALTDSVLEIIVEYDGTLYADELCNLDYTIVV